MRAVDEELEVAPGQLPEYLRVFHLDRWIDGVGEDPEWCAVDCAPQRAQRRVMAARRLWSSAGRAWCAERGGDWYAMTRPGAVVGR